MHTPTDFILQIYISQGSVATQLRCGGIFYNHIANVPQNVPVKKNKNRSIFGKGMDKSFSLLFGSPCISDIKKNLACTVVFVCFSHFHKKSVYLFKCKTMTSIS